MTIREYRGFDIASPQPFLQKYPPVLPLVTDVRIVHCTFVERYNPDRTITYLILLSDRVFMDKEEIIQRAEKFLPIHWQDKPIQITFDEADTIPAPTTAEHYYAIIVHQAIEKYPLYQDQVPLYERKLIIELLDSGRIKRQVDEYGNTYYEPSF